MGPSIICAQVCPVTFLPGTLYIPSCPRGGGGGAVKAREACRLGLPSVRTGLTCVVLQEIVYIARPPPLGKHISMGESGAVVPLLTSAAAALWRPSHGGAGDAAFGGCSLPPLWEM